jgi:hypothetical protein
VKYGRILTWVFVIVAFIILFKIFDGPSYIELGAGENAIRIRRGFDSGAFFWNSVIALVAHAIYLIPFWGLYYLSDNSVGAKIFFSVLAIIWFIALLDNLSEEGPLVITYAIVSLIANILAFIFSTPQSIYDDSTPGEDFGWDAWDD